MSCILLSAARASLFTSHKTVWHWYRLFCYNGCFYNTSWLIHDWKMKWFQYNEFGLVQTQFFMGKGSWKSGRKMRTFSRKWESPQLNYGWDWGPFYSILRKLEMRACSGAPSLESPALCRLLARGLYTSLPVDIHCSLAAQSSSVCIFLALTWCHSQLIYFLLLKYLLKQPSTMLSSLPGSSVLSLEIQAINFFLLVFWL